MEDVPTIAFWQGVPLNELPREELEQALIDTHRQLEQKWTNWCDSSVAHIRDLAAMRRGYPAVKVRPD